MDRVLVALTGATGALGTSLVAELRRRGHAVRALVRHAKPVADVDCVEGSLDDVGALDRLVDGADAIVHLGLAPMDAPPPAGRSQAEQFFQTNVLSALRLIERTPATRHRQLVFASSLAVYGREPHNLPGADRLPLDEDFPVWPREFYGAHKAALEKMIIGAAGDPGMNTCALRFGAILADYRERARDYLARTVDEAIDHGELRTQMGAYVLTARDAATIVADTLGDAAVRGAVLNVFDRWLDFADLATPLSALLGRDVRVACPKAPAPTPAVSNARLTARLRTRQLPWHTDEEIAALLERRARDRQA